MTGGFVLYLTFALLVVTGLFIFTYYNFTRSQTRLTHRFLFNEMTYQLAMAGVNQGLAFFDNPLAPQAAEQCPLIKALLKGENPTGKACIFTDSDSPFLADIIVSGDYARLGDPEVQVRMELLEIKPIYDPMRLLKPPLTAIDAKERYGLLEITSTATYYGIQRTVRCRKRIKVVNALPKAVGRFTLFAQDASPRDTHVLNQFLYEKKTVFPKITGRPKPGKNLRTPFIIFNGDKKTKLKERGWIFLGDMSNSPWELNLTFGDGEKETYGEGFHLLRTGYYITKDPGLPANVDDTALGAAYDRLTIQTGYFMDVKKDNALFAKFPFIQDPLGCTLLHLYGSRKDPSPTIVLGRAYRRYLRFNYLTNKDRTNACYLPYSVVAFLRDVPFPVNPVFPKASLNALFKNMPTYRYFMSSVLCEPYNRSYDFVSRYQQGKPEILDPPYSLRSKCPKNLKGLNVADQPCGDTGFLYDPEKSARVAIYPEPSGKDTGDPIFQGDLNKFTIADLQIPERVTYVFEATDWARWTQDGELTVKGILYTDTGKVSGAPLVIDKPLIIKQGGIVCNRGDILIRGIITRDKEAKTPLTLMSLEGKIIIDSPHIEASLVALGEGGAIAKGNNTEKIEIIGNVITSALDTDSFCMGRPIPKVLTRTLTYDPDLDPAKKTNYMAAYRIVMNNKRECFLIPGYR